MALNFAEFRLLSSRMFAIESGKLAKVPRRLWSQRFGSSAKFLAVLKVVCNKRLCQKCFHIDGRAPLRVPLHCLGEVTEGAACQNARVRTLMVAIPRSNNTVVMRACPCCVQVPSERRLPPSRRPDLSRGALRRRRRRVARTLS